MVPPNRVSAGTRSVWCVSLWSSVGRSMPPGLRTGGGSGGRTAHNHSLSLLAAPRGALGCAYFTGSRGAAPGPARPRRPAPEPRGYGDANAREAEAEAGAEKQKADATPHRITVKGMPEATSSSSASFFHRSTSQKRLRSAAGKPNLPVP